MNSIQLAQLSLETSKGMTMSLLEDLKDAPLATPTPNGGNHAHWIIGHLAYSTSSLLNGMIKGSETCPLEDLKEKFSFGTNPDPKATDYPDMDTLIESYNSAHDEFVAYVGTLAESDLDQPAKGCPDEYKNFFGTVGQCVSVQSLHPTMHYGQLADIRKALGRAPLMG